MFGALWLGAVIATLLQVAINDGNYYEMINAGQNALGHCGDVRRHLPAPQDWQPATADLSDPVLAGRRHGQLADIVAVLAAVGFGAWGLGLLPGQESAPAVGLPSVEAWVLAGVIYAALAAIFARTPQATRLLGFGWPPGADTSRSTVDDPLGK